MGAFFCQVWLFSVHLRRLELPTRGRAASWEDPGAQGKARPPERWPESCGRSLDDDFQVEGWRLDAEGCRRAIRGLEGRKLRVPGWRLKVAGWRLKGGGWSLRVEGWKLRVRSLKLRVGGWRLRGGVWRLKARG